MGAADEQVFNQARFLEALARLEAEPGNAFFPVGIMHRAVARVLEERCDPLAAGFHRLADPVHLGLDLAVRLDRPFGQRQQVLLLGVRREFLLLGTFLVFRGFLVGSEIRDLLAHRIDGLADTLGNLERTGQRQAAGNLGRNALVIDEILGEAVFAGRDPFRNQAGALVARAAGAFLIALATNRQVAAVTHIFRCHRAGRAVGHGVQVADISRRAGPVFAALARIEKGALGLRVGDLTLEFSLAQLFADNALGRAGLVAGHRIGGPSRPVVRAFPVFAALARIEKSTLRLLLLYLALIPRLGRGADFLVVGTAIRGDVGRMCRARAQRQTGYESGRNGHQCEVTSNIR